MPIAFLLSSTLIPHIFLVPIGCFHILMPNPPCTGFWFACDNNIIMLLVLQVLIYIFINKNGGICRKKNIDALFLKNI
jgi:hypothetical protein